MDYSMIANKQGVITASSKVWLVDMQNFNGDRRVNSKVQVNILEEAEENKFSFEGKIKEKGVQIVSGCLVGKVLHIRGVNVEELRATLN